MVDNNLQINKSQNGDSDAKGENSFSNSNNSTCLIITRKDISPKKRGRVVNFRSFVIIALATVAAVFAVRVDFIFEGLGIGLLAALILLLVGFAFYYGLKKKPPFKTATFIVAIIFAASAGVHFLFNVRLESFACGESNQLVAGKVDDVDLSENRIIIKNLYINGNRERGRLRLSIDFLEVDEYLYLLQVGDYLMFRARLSANPFLRQNGSINRHVRRTRIKYSVFELYNNDITIAPGRADFFQSIQENMRQNLNLRMGIEYGAIAFGMITGDRSAIAPETRESYSAAGLMHILSVSGLHLGFLSLLLMKIFSWLKLRRWQGNVLVIIAAWCYAIFVGLAPGITRAAIMITIFIISLTVSGDYDSLNALGIAVAGILAFAPWFLFDVGFLFSMGAVFGIILFARPIRVALRKLRLPDFIAQKLSLSISAQLGIIPAMIYFFNSVQIYSVLVNLLVNPLLSFAFIGSFLGVLLAMIWVQLGSVLILPGIAIAAIDSVAMAAASLPNALFFVLPIFGGLAFIAYAFYFISSRFIIISAGDSSANKARAKKIWIAKSAVAFACAAFILTISIPLTSSFNGDNFVAPVSAPRDVTSVVRHNGRTYVVGDLRNFNALDDTLRRINVRSGSAAVGGNIAIDAVFLTELTSAQVVPLTRLFRRYRFAVAFVYQGSFEPAALSALASRGVLNVTIFCRYKSITNDMLPVVTEHGRVQGFELLTQNGSILFMGNRSRYNFVDSAVLYRTIAIRSTSFLGYKPDRIFLTNFATNQFVPENLAPALQITPSEYNKYIFNFYTGETIAFRR